jgi:hypothetical protein
VQSIGDKAFYGCDKLGTVIFLGYEAPRLEEEYDTAYITYENMPQTGYYNTKNRSDKGLGISPYYMWMSSNFSYFYFGANFVDHIGHLDDNNSLVMVRPINGQHYDTFIFAQYFPTVVDGHYAPTEDTLKVIELIAALPDAADVTLAHKEQIEEVFQDLYWVDIEDHFEDAYEVTEEARCGAKWYESRH